MQPPAPAAAPRRPVPVSVASVLLIVMAVGGLAYAIAVLSVAPGTVARFRAAAGAGSPDVDGFVTVVWTAAAVGVVLAVILFALYVVLALGLRRGSNGARIATWVVAGLGVLAGCGSTVTTAAEQAGDPVPGAVGTLLADAYPQSWIGINLVMSVAQLLGYLLVAILLLASPGTFFGGAPKPLPPDRFAAAGPGGYPPVGYPAFPAGQGAPPAAGHGWSYPPYPPVAGQPLPPAAPLATPPLSGPPAPGPDDEYWSRPSS
jgi:hypothetical protein